MKPGEEAEWEKVKQGDAEARRRMIERHLPLVALTRNRQLRRAPDRFDEDLLGAGRLALVAAVDRFEPSRGVKFSSYAIARIRGAMVEWLRRDDWTPRSVRDRQRRGEAVQILTQVSLETILYADEDGPDVRLLGSLVDPGGNPDEIVPDEIERQVLVALVGCLPGRERRIVEAHYWEEETFDGIGRQVGLSGTGAHLVHDETLSLLKIWLVERCHAG